MMVIVKSKTYEQLKHLLGKKVHFKSDCELFPNFDVSGKVIEMRYGSNLEILFKFVSFNGKTIDIGSNMKNLRYELIN